MAKIQIQDLPGDMSISYEEMRRIHGGIQIVIDTGRAENLLGSIFGKTKRVVRSGADYVSDAFGGSDSSSDSSSSSSGSKPTVTTFETSSGS